MPTVRGWVALAAVLLSCAWLGANCLNDFLSLNRPVQAEILILEPWLPDYALQGAVGEIKRGGYRRVIIPGGGLPEYWRISTYKTEAEVVAAALAAMGVETNLVVALPRSHDLRDRTYSAALAVRAWLESSHPAVRAVSLHSMGPHSRRSRLLYQKAFGSRVKVSTPAALTPSPSPIRWERVAAGRVRVGVFSHPDDRYDPKRWWASSNGFREVLSEGIAYLYTRILFHPPKTE